MNQINESHRARLLELEATNKELRRHVVACEASDSAPSSSGISSIPLDVASKPSCEDIMNEYHVFNVRESLLVVNILRRKLELYDFEFEFQRAFRHIGCR